ncbi:MAG: hypothetical protein H6840_08425 [Planctomycetes bacterium]|nr:hypothetical protein [Planctomycetota bacterium]
MTAFRPILLLLLAALPAGLGVRADDTPAAPPRRVSEAELEAAQKAIDSLDPHHAGLLNGLRYLMRPEYELDLMAGRGFCYCPLRPYERRGLAPLTLLESLRLWAVLNSGLDVNEATRRQLLHFLDSNLPDASRSLAHFGVQLAVCLEASRRPELGLDKEINRRAEDLVELGMRSRRGTDADSPLIKGTLILPMWYGNQLWRGLICRYAIELGIKFNERVWETALRNLSGACHKTRGWLSTQGATERPEWDIDTNLLAIAAANLAKGVPEGTLREPVLRALDKNLANVNEVLKRLEDDYPDERITGSRLAVVQLFAPECAPEGLEPEAWHKLLMQQALKTDDPTGASRGDHAMAAALGLCDADSRIGRLVAETALACLAFGGGLLPQGKPPLAELGLPVAGRAMYALSLRHAAVLQPGSPALDDMDADIERAIKKGCDYLLSVQAKDGGFTAPDGYGGMGVPGAAGALLALMHGQCSRDSEEIKRGMEYLTRETIGAGTYRDALVLMTFQKYYEPEQLAAGIMTADSPEAFRAAQQAVWKQIDKAHRKLIQDLADNLDGAQNAHGWGYGPPQPGSGAGNYADNSCSQFGVLGMKAASLLGAKLKPDCFKCEAQRLIKTFQEDGPFEDLAWRWLCAPEGDKPPREMTGKAHPGGWSYMGNSEPSMSMTAGGVSSLAICRDELKVRGVLDDSLERKIEITVMAATHWLSRYYFGLDADKLLVNNPAIHRDLYYNLYSVERAGVLAETPLFGGELDWYAIGASALVTHQQSDGSWGLPVSGTEEKDRDYRANVLNIAWAILFLKKAALPMVGEPKRPTPPPKEPPSPTTNNPKPKPEPKSPTTGN